MCIINQKNTITKEPLAVADTTLEEMRQEHRAEQALSTAPLATNVQRHAYQLTINNPLTYGLDHPAIKKILVENFPTLRYFCMGDEVGEEGTPHTHVYINFSSRVRFSTIKRHFEKAHIEAAHGPVQSNMDYVRKSGKWANTSKAETRVEGTFEEWGKPPVQKGKRIDMEELYELVEAGYTNAEILAINNDYILNIDKIDKLRTMLLTEKFKGQRRLNLKVIYVYGKTGAGKTRDILNRHGDANVYRVTDYNHPFDGYACQEVLVFDEFRSGLRISDMLNYCDVYPLELPARYANRYACYTLVYIVSNWKLEEQYPEVQQTSPETWKAFLRRISEVQVYGSDGSVKVYDSVEAYLHRGEEFHPVSEEDRCPFLEQMELPFTDPEASHGNE